VYIDSVFEKVRLIANGCHNNEMVLCCVSILMYVDDILLLAPSVLTVELAKCLRHT